MSQVELLDLPLGTMGNLEVEFLWPYELANGKWLLYPTEILTTGVSGSHCKPPGDIVNPLMLNVSCWGGGVVLQLKCGGGVLGAEMGSATFLGV